MEERRTGNAEVPRKNSRELRKERIARYAASLVEDGDSILLIHQHHSPCDGKIYHQPECNDHYK